MATAAVAAALKRSYHGATRMSELGQRLYLQCRRRFSESRVRVTVSNACQADMRCYSSRSNYTEDRSSTTSSFSTQTPEPLATTDHSSEYAGKHQIRRVSLSLRLLLIVLPSHVFIQAFHRHVQEVSEQECHQQHTGQHYTSCEHVPATPRHVGAVIDVPRRAPQSSGEDLASILRSRFGPLALQLCQQLRHAPNGEQSRVSHNVEAQRLGCPGDADLRAGGS